MKNRTNVRKNNDEILSKIGFNEVAIANKKRSAAATGLCANGFQGNVCIETNNEMSQCDMKCLRHEITLTCNEIKFALLCA